MAELELKSHRFRVEREADWRRLEKLLGQVERGSLRSLTPRELLDLPVLYRATLSSLSVARSISLDQALVAYLESLATRGYFLVYGVRSRVWARVGEFFAGGWSQAVRSIWRETLAAVLLGVIGTVAAYVLVSHDPDWFFSFVPEGMTQGRDPTATTAVLRQTLHYAGGHDDALTTFATFLFTHNAQIALLAFALGFAFGLPTAGLLLVNGCSLGAFLALFVSRGLGWEATGWLMIHGVTELFAVTLAGAAGFSIGWATAFPGARSRLDAIAQAGARAAAVMCGVLVMLSLAGLLEGIGRQLIDAEWARLSIAGTTAVVWLAYFYLPRPVRAHG
jgi:uncharacterized membrane protein SpoIIM required for sporulation